MVFWPTPPMVFQPRPTHGILNRLPMAFWSPTLGILTPIPIVFWPSIYGISTPYTWHFDVPIHGISAPYPTFLNPIAMVYRPPYLWYFDAPPTHGSLTPYSWYFDPRTEGILNPPTYCISNSLWASFSIINRKVCSLYNNICLREWFFILNKLPTNELSDIYIIVIRNSNLVVTQFVV